MAKGSITVTLVVNNQKAMRALMAIRRLAAELEEDQPWNGCDLAMGNDELEKDDIRTEFDLPEVSVAWWNAMNPLDGSAPAYNAYDPKTKSRQETPMTKKAEAIVAATNALLGDFSELPDVAETDGQRAIEAKAGTHSADG